MKTAIASTVLKDPVFIVVRSAIMTDEKEQFAKMIWRIWKSEARLNSKQQEGGDPTPSNSGKQGES